MSSSLPLQGLTPPPFRYLCAAPLLWLLLFAYMLGRGWYLLGYLPTYGNPSDPYALGLDPVNIVLVLVSMGLFPVMMYGVAYPVLLGLDMLLGHASKPVGVDWRGLLCFMALAGTVVGVRVLCPGQFNWVMD